MSNRQSVQLKPDQSQLAGLFAALKKLDKEANGKLKTDVASISAWSANEIKQAAPMNPFPKQAQAIASTIRANKDRIPNITLGGSKTMPVTRKVTNNNPAPKYGELLFGSEFGGPSMFPNGGRRFPFRSPAKGRGNEGYTIFKRLSQIQPEITHRWKTAVDEVLSNWSKG